MRVAVDARSFRAAGTGRGIAVYLERLLDELRRVDSDNRYEPVEDSRALRAAAAVFGRPRLNRLAGGCDVVWAPAPAPLAVSPGVPLVLTVHDLSFEEPADFTRYERLWHRLARPERLGGRGERGVCPSGT